jgi:arylsulfatase A-like enzyme
MGGKAMKRFLAGAGALAGLASVAAAAAEKPNIILIMTDQQAGMALGCAGNPYARTPAMDRLAENGIRFRNAYCSFPLSGPSRAAMFTGLYPGESGLDENGMELPDSLAGKTLGELLTAAGYDCGYVGKWHIGPVSLPGDSHGFRSIKGNGDEGLAEAAVGYLKERHRKPFFMVASFTNPHNICEFARGQKTPMADIGPRPPVEDCPGLPSNFAVAPYDASVIAFERSQSYSLYPTQSYTNDDWRQYLNAYYRLLEHVDAEIGKIVDEIDRQNLWKNTLIIFTSDHGDGAAAHHWNQKTALYEEVANIPLIVCLPGKKHAGEVSEVLVNNGVDLMPTLCAVTGASLPQGRSGVDLLAAFESGNLPEYVVTETNFKQTAGTFGWIVRTQKYKYVLYDKGRYREQLFDMESDRGETRNLAVESSSADILEQHRKILRSWLEDHPGPERWRHLRFIP